MASNMDEKDKLDQISRRIIGAAIEVHKTVGPGLLESAYQACLAFELREQGFKVEEQTPLPVVYKGVHLDCGYRMDLIVEDVIVVESQSCRATGPDSRSAITFISEALKQKSWSANEFS